MVLCQPFQNRLCGGWVQLDNPAGHCCQVFHNFFRVGMKSRNIEIAPAAAHRDSFGLFEVVQRQIIVSGGVVHQCFRVDDAKARCDGFPADKAEPYQDFSKELPVIQRDLLVETYVELFPGDVPVFNQIFADEHV